LQQLDQVEEPFISNEEEDPHQGYGVGIC